MALAGSREPMSMFDERIHCDNCGKSVSTPVPKDTLVRAWVQCPECIEKGEGLEAAVMQARAEIARRRNAALS